MGNRSKLKLPGRPEDRTARSSSAGQPASSHSRVPPSHVPRLVADVELPDYAYVPGCTPRPTEAPSSSQRIEPTNWSSCQEYLLGIDLFNNGYYWEAHEQWESVWLAAGRRGRTADFLKGLIKLAASFVKAREGRPIGVARHARRAGELFRAASADLTDTNFMGLSLPALEQEAARVAAAPEEVVDTSDAAVVRLTPFVMRLVDPESPH